MKLGIISTVMIEHVIFLKHSNDRKCYIKIEEEKTYIQKTTKDLKWILEVHHHIKDQM